MLSESNLRELVEFTAPHPVLSVYLNTDPSEGNADAYRLRLRSMLKGVHLPQDVEAVEHHFSHEYNWAGRGVAVFSCAPQGFFRAYPLAMPVRDMVSISDRPSVKQLANLFDTHGGYGVVLVDKQGARVFSFHLGELREQEGVMGEAVKHTKHGGASTVAGRRGGTAGRVHNDDEIVDRNMKDAVEFATRFFEENHVRRILIGGSDDNVKPFQALLPKAWQSLVVGTFPMAMTASHTDVLNRAMQVGMEAEARRELRLVDDLITQNAKGGNAVTGLENVLRAANEARVHTLVLTQGTQAGGYVCLNCGNLFTARGACAACGGETERIVDVVDAAVHSVLRNGGAIEVVGPEAGLGKAGNIGALLRY